MPDREKLIAVCKEWLAKALKAILILEGIDFPKTHDIEALIMRIPLRLRPEISPEEQAELTEYATGARYPGWEDISLATARRAVAVARRVRREVRRRLPRKALRRKLPLTQ
jgi:HEPN domain-containing protein